MASVLITNVSAAKVSLSELYITLGATGQLNSSVGPVDHVTVVMPTTRLTAMPGVMALAAAGTITVAVTPSADELASGFLTPPNAVQTADIVDLAVTLPKLVRQLSGKILVGKGVGADMAAVTMSGDATMADTGVVTVSGVSASGMSDLASNANAKGASLIGIEDAASLITATTAELALAELAKYECISLADPGTGVAIPVTRSATVEITTAGAETNTLAVPTFLGQRLLLVLDTRVGGNRVVTSAQRINTAGNTIITLDTAGDAIQLIAIKIAGAFRWQVAFNDGATLS